MDGRLYFTEAVTAPKLPETSRSTAPAGRKNGATAFDQVLNQKLQEHIRFSAHAEQRLKSRDIDLEQADLHKVNQAVEQARAKGSRESLVLMDDLAFVVSVKNNTVITVLDKESFQNNVFTNIDSTVII
jgi:flagellar operon protein